MKNLRHVKCIGECTLWDSVNFLKLVCDAAHFRAKGTLAYLNMNICRRRTTVVTRETRVQMRLHACDSQLVDLDLVMTTRFRGNGTPTEATHIFCDLNKDGRFSGEEHILLSQHLADTT